MPSASMHLRVLLPFAVFADQTGVARIVAETGAGSFGLWPQRLDCAAALVQGILTYESAAGEVFVAVDEGVLVKTGAEVVVSVRRAIAGIDLARLRDAVLREFVAQDEAQRDARAALVRVEVGLMRRFADSRRG